MLTGDRGVLIVGQRPDIHIDTVARYLIEAGARVVILDRASLSRCSLRLANGITSGILITDSNVDVALDKFSVVWWRVKPSSVAEFSGGTGDVAESLRWAEWREQLRSLPSFTGHAQWVNPLAHHIAISRKPVQLALAAEVGFAIPETVITNDAERVLPLFARHHRVIYKTLSSFIIPPNEIIYTNEVTEDQVRQHRLAIALAPGIFQEYIEKAYELRITVVGDSIFIVKIDSQSKSDTKIDWRRNQHSSMYSLATIDVDFDRRLRDFQRRAGLVYGAYDFIVQPDGRPVFVECNPGGQWLWLENALEIPISRTFARVLLPK